MTSGSSSVLHAIAMAVDRWRRGTFPESRVRHLNRSVIRCNAGGLLLLATKVRRRPAPERGVPDRSRSRSGQGWRLSDIAHRILVVPGVRSSVLSVRRLLNRFGFGPSRGRSVETERLSRRFQVSEPGGSPPLGGTLSYRDLVPERGPCRTARAAMERMQDLMKPDDRLYPEATIRRQSDDVRKLRSRCGPSREVCQTVPCRSVSIRANSRWSRQAPSILR